MRKIFLAGIILLISIHASAQGRFGIKAGVNYFVLPSDNTKTSDYSGGKLGYIAGLSYELSINSRFSVQPELNFAGLRAKENYYGTTIKLSYIQVPILFKFNIPQSKVSIYGGPQLGFLGNSDFKRGDGSEGSGDDLTQTDFGATIGVGHVPTSPGISFDVRAFAGFTNVIKSEYVGGIKTRPFMFSATVGYLFGTKK